ncbi:MFS transporter [Desulfitobacterium chlororespirans]|uniref:MFS transporter, ACS family, D-galactonate transporter n=1 Tax=Desulfitobacterium chlororespirans DSM 11544 TaxID=1121395 RepID=A0A1M7UXH6_9FIRM|nr:MFS transporter [Desulfitobacterium chlororespirans]SHN87617.1 MFS transporter, ACS family, D-galactonate transporter [Desulfitobacterium chlororespirans DSM 11544]
MTKGKKMYLLILICLLFLISYLDRVIISITAPSIMEEFKFDAGTMGLIFSAFAYPYALLQMVGGSLGDKFGPRKVLTGLMTWWSLFCIATGQAWNFISLFVYRVAFGLGEAGGFPVATRALRGLFGQEKNGFLQGLTHACSRFGGAIAPPIVVFLMLKWNWRAPFFLLGAIGLVWAILFWVSFREETSSDAEEKKKAEKLPWKALLGSRNMWMLVFTDFCYGYSLWIYLTWMPSYLTGVREFTIMKMGFYASLPLTLGIFGDLIGGWVSDFMFKVNGNLRMARRIPIAIAFPTASLFVWFGLNTNSGIAAVWLLAGAFFFLELANANLWATAMDVGGKKFSGSASGMMNTGFGIAGIVSPIVFGYLLEYTGSWSYPFYVGVGLLLLGTIAIFMVDPTKSLDTQE